MLFAVDSSRERNEARWIEHPVLKDATKVKFTNLCNETKKVMNKSTTATEIRAAADKVLWFRPFFITRRKASDLCWGRPTKVLPKTKHTVIGVQFPTELIPKLYQKEIALTSQSGLWLGAIPASSLTSISSNPLENYS
jgi:hypothetical protein